MVSSNIPFDISREFAHRAKGINMSTFSAEEVAALQHDGGNKVDRGLCYPLIFREQCLVGELAGILRPFLCLTVVTGQGSDSLSRPRM